MMPNILILAILCLLNLHFYVHGIPIDVQLMAQSSSGHEQAPQTKLDRGLAIWRRVITNIRLIGIPIDDRLALMEKAVTLIPDEVAWSGLVKQLFEALEEAGMDSDSIQELDKIAQRAYEPMFVQEILNLDALAKKAGVPAKTFLTDPRNDQPIRMRLNLHNLMGGLVDKLKHVAPAWEQEFDKIYTVRTH
jgi:hypothetical protein